MLEAVRAGATFPAARDRHLAGLESRDRRLAYELAAGVLRRRSSVDALLDLDRADRRLHDILRLGAYQLRFLSRIPAHAAVSTSVDLARHAAGEGAARYVNQALRAIARTQETDRGTPQPTHPAWLARRWREQFGANDAERLLAWNDRRRPIILQPAKWSQDELTRHLKSAGVRFADAPFGTGVELLAAEAPGAHRSRPEDLPGYREGGWIVQDPAHALVCRFAAIPQGQLVYDACAAPGGKSVSLERLGSRVLAGDDGRERMVRLAQTTRRAGRSIRLICADVRSAPLAARSVDAVMLDAPCTATGTIARHPDARWRLRPSTIERAALRQRKLVAAAAGLVRAGGLLIYSTCSLEREENEAVVHDFLSTHPAFVRAPLDAAVPNTLITPEGDLRTLPHRDAVDGAYAARLMRVA
jgi:16S rRNA (cytosine967-C5)-methyltransferase